MLGWFRSRRDVRRTRLHALEAAHAALDDRLKALEADLPRYQLAMQNLVEEAGEFFDRAERKRGRAAAAESRLRREATPDGDGELFEKPKPGDPKDTPAIRAAVARLRGMH